MSPFATGSESCTSARARGPRASRLLSAAAAACLLLVLLPLSARAVRLRQLTFTARDENWATWAPDGATVFLSSGEYVCGSGEWFCGDQNIWMLTVIGGQGVALTFELADAYHPRVSPDGKWVAGMVHNGDDFDIVLWHMGDFEHGTLFQSEPGKSERFPNWSNDSQFIAFDSGGPTERGTEFQIYYAPVNEPTDPSARVRVTYTGISNRHPTWNRDGTEIAYVGNAANQRSISAIRLADGRYREITPVASQNRHPDWSPDGKWIAFTTDRWDGIGDVAIVRADGDGEPVRVTVGMNGHDDFPEWSLDSRKLILCGTALVPPYQPNKEIFMADDLPFDEAGVPIHTRTFSSLKSRFRKP
jgi:Tol biopolymer transport system component